MLLIPCSRSGGHRDKAKIPLGQIWAFYENNPQRAEKKGLSMHNVEDEQP
ncbi:hypothetical protein [Nonomuraea sp. NPDC049684]